MDFDNPDIAFGESFRKEYYKLARRISILLIGLALCIALLLYGFSIENKIFMLSGLLPLLPSVFYFFITNDHNFINFGNKNKIRIVDNKIVALDEDYSTKFLKTEGDVDNVMYYEQLPKLFRSIAIFDLKNIDSISVLNDEKMEIGHLQIDIDMEKTLLFKKECVEIIFKEPLRIMEQYTFSKFEDRGRSLGRIFISLDDPESFVEYVTSRIKKI